MTEDDEFDAHEEEVTRCLNLQGETEREDYLADEVLRLRKRLENATYTASEVKVLTEKEPGMTNLKNTLKRIWRGRNRQTALNQINATHLTDWLHNELAGTDEPEAEEAYRSVIDRVARMRS